MGISHLSFVICHLSRVRNSSPTSPASPASPAPPAPSSPSSPSSFLV
ncbi:hypothetical protein GXM_01309 [Nostoc sphaeroides CCNUC1]|uniref:Uncharacterized protein n=1 Tax=Nostoc sphaeroides CCNUC1 TaxID=2653204 RepID=A0A5P8VUL1_9NOSO|nr:hypothetical protein GXM_01309 [Nostoc sphaeroides CCNUC1]